MKAGLLEQLGNNLDAVTAALGTETFERQLADFLGRMITHDMMSIARYSAVGPPEFLAHSANYSPQVVQRYLDVYHLFDPYAEHWRETRKPGPVFLRDLSSGRRKVGRYIREFLPESGIADEMGIFLPPLAGSSLAVFFESVGRRFGKSDRTLLCSLYPLAANLYRAHLTVLFSRPQQDAESSPSTDHPMLVTDRAGRALWATTSWAGLSADARAKVEALAKRGAGGSFEITSLDEDQSLISEPFHSGGVPDKLLWVVRNKNAGPGPADSVAVGMSTFDDVLTPREREIVELILKGYPTSLIAEKLSLSRGTVKNHRRRIYDKLDITTERELFLMLMEAVIGTNPGVPE